MDGTIFSNLPFKWRQWDYKSSLKGVVTYLPSLPFLFVAFLFILSAAGCGSGASSSSDASPVTLSFSVPSSGPHAAAAVPSSVASIKVEVVEWTPSETAINLLTDTFNVVAGSNVTRNYSIPAGLSREFTVSAYSGAGGSGTLLYQGSTMVDLSPGVPATVTISMTATAPAGWPGTMQFGSVYDDNGRGAAVDSSGNIFVTGNVAGGLDGNIFSGVQDLFLIKYNSSGVKQWTRQLGTATNDIALGVAVDPSGNAYVAGYTLGGLDGNVNAGGQDFFLVKYDTNGIKQWTQQFGTAMNDVARGVAVDSSGNAYVTGYTYGGLDGNVLSGSIDLFLVKYDSAGVRQWTRQLGTPTWTYATSASVDATGNVYVTGYTVGGLDGNVSSGAIDLFLVKYDSAGVKQWTQQLGTAANDEGLGVAVDSSGNAYVTGYTGGGLDGNVFSGVLDLFLVKYDTNGVKQWTQQLGTATWESATGAAVDSAGNIYMTGDTNGGLDGNVSSGAIDLFLVKYDTNGVKQWTQQLGTATNDYGLGVAVDSSSNAYVTGYTGGGLDGNAGIGGADIFLLKYDSAGVKQ